MVGLKYPPGPVLANYHARVARQRRAAIDSVTAQAMIAQMIAANRALRAPAAPLHQEHRLTSFCQLTSHHPAPCSGTNHHSIVSFAQLLGCDLRKLRWSVRAGRPLNRRAVAHHRPACLRAMRPAACVRVVILRHQRIRIPKPASLLSSCELRKQRVLRRCGQLCELRISQPFEASQKLVLLVRPIARQQPRDIVLTFRLGTIRPAVASRNYPPGKRPQHLSLLICDSSTPRFASQPRTIHSTS